MAGSLVTRGRDLLHRKDPTTALTDRVRALREAADACEGRVSTEVVDEAYRVSLQVDRRLALSGGATVVALAGATGSGKSSTFNALTGTELATVGVRRPTTSSTMAASWGEDAGEELLDWLQVRRRHVVEAPASAARAEALDGLVLLDLPDHDSTAAEHRTEVDRLVALVDVLVWVVDPQKYADAALHERYLRPLAGHAAVMLVVLNQVDSLTPDARAACLRDLRRLLDAEGLGSVEVLGVSALTGEGLDTLLTRLARVVAGKRAAAARLAADVGAVATRLASASGTDAAPELSRRTVQTLDAQLGEAAGVPVVTQAVDQAWRLRGGLATGWPVLAWVAKFKPDPLRRLRLAGRGRKEIASPTRTSRTSLPARSGVQQARVDTALRTLADEASDGLRRGWSDAVRATTRRSGDGLSDALDRAVATTDLDVDRHRRWWSAVRVLQWVLFAGSWSAWVGSAPRSCSRTCSCRRCREVVWFRFPAPTVLVVGGVVAGLVVAALARIGVVIGARRRARLARQRLLAAVSRVSADQVVAPVRAELERYETARSAILRARG